MLIHCGLLLLFMTCVRTTEIIYGDELASRASDFNRFSLWPSVHNAATLLRIKRSKPVEAEPNEDTNAAAAQQPPDSVQAPSPSQPPPPPPPPASKAPADKTNDVAKNISQILETTPKVPGLKTTPGTSVVSTTPSNITSTEKPKALDLNNPGVVKRGLIVFGGFALMAAAYFIFYKRKNKNPDMANSLGMNDANQFRYGVLQNEDMKDNLESSRIPLTLESEDEIDDDLEIFDLMQKKKSLSYVNLQQNDEEVVLSPREVDIEGDNLLLDIEDESSDILINWSNNGSKSIL